LTFALDAGNFGIAVKGSGRGIGEQRSRFAQGLTFCSKTNLRRNLHAICARTACFIEARLRCIQAIARIGRITFSFAAFTLYFDLVAAELFFGLLGAGLAFGFCDAAQFVHAGTVAFSLGASAATEHGEEVGAAGSEHAGAKFRGPSQRLILHVRGNAVAKYVEERFGHGLLPGLGGHVAFKADKTAFCKKALEEI
jgi:hypothetical protein